MRSGGQEVGGVELVRGTFLKNMHLEDAHSLRSLFICVDLFRGNMKHPAVDVLPKTPGYYSQVPCSMAHRNISKTEREKTSCFSLLRVAAPLSFTGAGFTLLSETVKGCYMSETHCM